MVPNNTSSSNIAGGFIAIPVARLIATWRACASKPLKKNDFRTWLAAHEMLARRTKITHKQTQKFAIPELAKLLGGLSQRRVKASIKRLADAGTIVFGPKSIEFPHTNEIEQTLDTIGRGRGVVFVPRPILRHLAESGTPAIIATTIAVLLRCLSRRRTGFNGRGRLKASWIAKLFAVDLRRVKHARRELLKMGWIEAEPTDQKAENRWGRAFRINLQWQPNQGATLPPPDLVSRRGFATPSFNPDPILEENQHQEPASPHQAGSCIQAGKQEQPRPTITPMRPAAQVSKPAAQVSKPAAQVSKPAAAASKLGPPRLDDIRPEDLGSVERLLELHDQAIKRGLVGSSESDRLKFVALGEHALVVGKRNPPGLFASLLRRGAWSFITQGEEDAARRKLKAHLWGPSPVSIGVGFEKRPAMVTLSSDAVLVREVTRVLALAGYRGDGFPHLRRRDSSWTRCRWDRALSELSGARG